MQNTKSNRHISNNIVHNNIITNSGFLEHPHENIQDTIIPLCHKTDHIMMSRKICPIVSLCPVFTQSRASWLEPRLAQQSVFYKHTGITNFIGSNIILKAHQVIYLNRLYELPDRMSFFRIQYLLEKIFPINCICTLFKNGFLS